MKYRIGSISKLLGVTTESLRNYQRLGIIESKKDGKSAYKCFDPISLGKLLAMRKLQTAGCRLADVSKSMKEYSLQEYASKLRLNLQSVREKLEYQKILLERMENHLAFAENLMDVDAPSMDISDVRSRIRVDINPSFYCFDYIIDGEIEVDESHLEQFVQWTQHMLFVLNYSPCTLDDLFAGNSSIKIGLAVETKFAELLELDVSPPVYMRPPKMSVVCPLRHLRDGKATGDTARVVLNFMRENNLSAADGAYYVNEISYHQNSEEFFFSKLYIPIRQEDETAARYVRRPASSKHAK